MRHGILASVGVLTLICLAVGDDQVTDETDLESAQHELQVEQKRRPPDKLDETDRCIQHIRIAAKYLKAVGIHEWADDLREKADEMEREVSQAKKRRAKEREYLLRELKKRELQLEKLKHNVNKLRDVNSRE